MKYQLQPYQIMEYGKRTDKEGRPHQEDAMSPDMGQAKPTDRVFVLCDGMGGHEAGEVASQTVAQTLYQSILNQQGGADNIITDAMLQQGLQDAYTALDAKDLGGAKKMGTTMTYLSFDPAGATIAHMGDSRVYHIRPGVTRDDTRILFRTSDHSLVNELVKLGELTEDEARRASNKNVITRALQPNLDIRPKADVYHTTDIRKGDYFLMCSDGILEQMSDDNLRFIFSAQGKDAATKVETLREQTQNNSDNHTAFVIEVTDVEGAPLPRPENSRSAFTLLSMPMEMKAAQQAQQAVPTVSPAAARSNKDFVTLDAAPAAPAPMGNRMNPISPMPPRPLPNQQKKKSNSVLWGVLTGLLTLAIVAALFWLFMGESEKESRPAEIEESVDPSGIDHIKPPHSSGQITSPGEGSNHSYDTRPQNGTNAPSRRTPERTEGTEGRSNAAETINNQNGSSTTNSTNNNGSGGDKPNKNDHNGSNSGTQTGTQNNMQTSPPASSTPAPSPTPSTHPETGDV